MKILFILCQLKCHTLMENYYTITNIGVMKYQYNVVNHTDVQKNVV